MRIEIGIAIKNYALWLFVRGIEKKMQAPGLVIRGRIRLRLLRITPYYCVSGA